ncbi:AgmX/PglI C-terminal domain-containing protein [Paraliomyxa miuraensis]|uniref:AgmX/PglI C-terminal domain-containing protein n=1 Tax=Paraliomyxa miuraensis TaxID=376150 RepID=UPI002255D9F7|nr:AgmX/PglI C-terminal domain-containing protein [Paraliomyxa miuraensis]MCX4244742.1 AgmX/PglI C-terminal domain-containing protein [Paraliomyxa miuraensis]
MRKTIALFVLVALGTGCSFIARDTETYKQENRSLLETRTPDIKACYDQALAANPNLKGEVAVSYTIEKKTGKFANMTVLADKTTAPEELQNCVMAALEGLQFAKPDQRDGIVESFTWSFQGQGKPAV